MSIIARQLLIFIWTCLVCGYSLMAYAEEDSSYVIENRRLHEKALSMRFHAPDSSIRLLNTCYDLYIRNGDTISASQTLLQVANIYGHQANYKLSYDKLWKALSIVDKSQYGAIKSEVLIAIGRYYSFYKRKAKALEYFTQSLEINRQRLEKGEEDKAILVPSYYAMCATYRELDEPSLAEKYLDSCFLVYSDASPIHSTYLNFEKAFLLKGSEQYKEAQLIYEEILPWIRKNDPGYQVLVYTYQGDTYRKLSDYASSEASYKTALNISAAYNSHIDFTPLVHKKLSDLYFSTGNLDKAYQSLKTFKELDEVFFDSRSENNRPLLEIQDAFRREEEQRNQLLQKQKLTQLEQEDKVLLLQRTLLSASLIFVVLIGFLYFNHVRAKYRAEKELIKNKQELEIQKANEIVEVKNKELAASALKLIEKDEFLAVLKNKVKESNGNVNVQELKSILKSTSISNAHNWKEFETRFIAVNQNFYSRLSKAYPNLTQGDLKLCALIKLNFSSKEMAKLLGISIESAHTSRYRLRKKLNLSREVNLTEFIAKL